MSDCQSEKGQGRVRRDRGGEKERSCCLLGEVVMMDGQKSGIKAAGTGR